LFHASPAAISSRYGGFSATYLVANDSEKLSVLEIRLAGHVDSLYRGLAAVMFVVGRDGLGLELAMDGISTMMALQAQPGRRWS
jgi:hypothetical protein